MLINIDHLKSQVRWSSRFYHIQAEVTLKHAHICFTMVKEFFTGGQDSLPAVSRPEATKEFSLLLLHPHQHFHQTSPALHTQLHRLVHLHEYILSLIASSHLNTTSQERSNY